MRRVSDVSGEIGLSPRRFIEVFKQQVGLTPKLFCRVRRFQRVLRRIYRREEVEWADLALSCGYFDQAHFIHDFKAFSGINPTAYVAAGGRHQNHVPIEG
jgi:AraC-like DNA-binding protein